MSYVYRYLYWLPGPFVPITDIGKLSISGNDIPADLIIGTPLATCVPNFIEIGAQEHSLRVT